MIKGSNLYAKTIFTRFIITTLPKHTFETITCLKKTDSYKPFEIRLRDVFKCAGEHLLGEIRGKAPKGV